MEIGLTLRLLLKQYGWTQPDLAERTGLSQPFISSICRGEKQPSLENVLKLCEVFCITPNELIWGSAAGADGTITASLSEHENTLLNKYRLLSTRDQAIADCLIDALSAPLTNHKQA